MKKTDDSPLRVPEDFYFFDSLKIAAFSKSLSIIAQLQFFESLKMEFDNGSSFCKHHIKRIVNSQAYHEKFNMHITDPSVSPQTKELYNDPEIFIKERLASNPDHSWTYYFYSATDFISFTSNLSRFFYGKPHDNSLKISIKPNTRTRFYEAVHDIYFYCSPFKKLARDKIFLSLLKNISCFSKMTYAEIYQKLTKY